MSPIVWYIALPCSAGLIAGYIIACIHKVDDELQYRYWLHLGGLTMWVGLILAALLALDLLTRHT